MNWKSKLLVIFFCVARLTFAESTSQCAFNSGTNGALPTATCTFASCPEGFDCSAPAINKTSANLTYSEPLKKWHETCPDTTIQSVCWEVNMGFQARVAATDPSGVSFIGINFAQEVANQRTFKKYWGQVSQKDAQGRYVMNGTIVAYVPPGHQLQLFDLRDLFQGRNQ